MQVFYSHAFFLSLKFIVDIYIKYQFAVLCFPYFQCWFYLSEGTMRPGDRIIEINGLDVTRFTLQHADSLLNQTGNDVILLIEYDVAIIGK